MLFGLIFCYAGLPVRNIRNLFSSFYLKLLLDLFHALVPIQSNSISLRFPPVLFHIQGASFRLHNFHPLTKTDFQAELLK